MSRREVYECSGIRIASDVPLSAPESVDGRAATADATVELGPSRVQPFERPSADVVAELSVDGYPFYTFCRVGSGYVGRMWEIADFEIDESLRHVVVRPAAGGREQVLPIVIPGTVTAFLLAMRGRFVLHASAVDLGGSALAFIGSSGQGKSTMAALFCATGAGLVADDVLPLEFEGRPGGSEAVSCIGSGGEIRLRDKAASLLERFPAEVPVRLTTDERFAVAPPPGGGGRLPLAAIVLPRPHHASTVVGARRLAPSEAALWLNRCLRIEGWRARDDLRRHFEDAARVAAVVPVCEVRVPWGPPFADDLPRRVLDGCGLLALSG